MKIVAFTGFRPEKMPFPCVEQNPRYLRFRKRLAQVVARLAEIKVEKFYTGMARGFDLWAAGEVLGLRLSGITQAKICCAVPFPGQNQRYSYGENLDYRRILDAADEVTYVRDAYSREAYLERNRFMVDRADTVVACYDGKSSGGTAYTVKYAREQRKTLVLLDPFTLKVTVENESAETEA